MVVFGSVVATCKWREWGRKNGVITSSETGKQHVWRHG